MSEVLPIEESPRFALSTATDGQTVFSVPFPFQAVTDLKIVKIVDGVETVLEIAEDYAVTGEGEAAGGSIELVQPAEAGWQILRLGQLVLDRVSSIVRAGKFASKATDDDLDRIIIGLQEVRRDLARAYKAKLGAVTGGLVDLGAAGQLPMFDSEGNLVPGPIWDDDLGVPGRSAYQVAVDNGFAGNEAAWLASLVGSQGTNGKFSGTEIIKTAAYTALAADVGKTIILNKATADTLSFDPAATLGSTWMVIVKNIGVGTWVLDPNSAETIDGVATISLLTGQSLVVASNGTALRTMFLPAADSVTNTELANMVQARIKGRAAAAGTGDPTDLTAAQVATILGALIDAIDGLTPAAGGFLRFDSSTTAAMAAIVGTVSQSGGTPTGAIIETGSNANGRYIRYADGTQICAFEIATGSRVFSGAGTYADPYRSNVANWTFPAAFSAAPTAVLSPRVDYPSNGIRRAATAAYLSVSSTMLSGVQCYMTASPSDVADTFATMVAVGRWF